MDASPEGLRVAVLAGQRADAEPWRDFLFAPSSEALAAWFGQRPTNLRTAIDADIAALEAMIAEQVDAILHHPRFLALEGRWRAMFWLARLAAAEGWRRRVLFLLLPVTWTEIARDQERAADYDQSFLFQKIYEETYGQAGGQPFGLIVVDHELRHLPSAETGVDDVAALQLLSQTGAAAFVPFIFAASPALLGLRSFEQLERVQTLRQVFAGRTHQRWNALMDRLDSRFIGITLPRVLIRPPWSDDAPHGLPFRYNEYAPNSADRVWVSAGFAFAAVVARAFAQYSWPADVRGADPDREGGGLVTRLPLEWFRSDLDGFWPRLPLEVLVTTEQERDLVDAGLMPVSALPYGSEPLFEVTRSLFRPSRYAGPNAEAAEANARLSAQINSVLCASRFAHHLKIMARDMVGSVTTADALERRLQEWLNQYVNPSLSAGPEMLAKYPLAEGRVTVADAPDRPGEYTTAIHLRPHYQLDDISAVLSLDMTVKQEAA